MNIILVSTYLLFKKIIIVFVIELEKCKAIRIKNSTRVEMRSSGFVLILINFRRCIEVVFLRSD